MGKEIEAKFINIDKDLTIKKLNDIGAVKVFDERLLRRYVYNLPTVKNSTWIRVRDEVDKTTMTYKRIIEKSLDGVEEVELVIDNFDNGRDFLKSIGLIEKAYQETKRLRYTIENGNVEFDIDTWPALEPYIEIEASSKEQVKKYAKLLGFDWNTAMFGSSDFVYEKMYKVDADWISNKCPILKFDKLPIELEK